MLGLDLGFEIGVGYELGFELGLDYELGLGFRMVGNLRISTNYFCLGFYMC